MQNIILRELVKFRLNYHKPYSADELEVIAMDWAEILEKQNIPMDVFIEACKLHKAHSEYFPNIKNLLDYCQDVWRERDRKRLRLVEPIPVLSPEQVKENADRVRSAIKKISQNKKERS